MRRVLLPSLLLLASAVATAAVVVPGVLLAGAPAPPAPPPEPSLHRVAAVADPARTVLADWDARRAAAWAAGDVAALASLYVPGSAAGRADRAMLRRWTGRGLVVEDLAVELLALEVLDAEEDRLRLRVTDRLSGGRAVGRGLNAPLPDDGPTTRRVTLVRVAGQWLVDEVRAAAPAD